MFERGEQHVTIKLLYKLCFAFYLSKPFDNVSLANTLYCGMVK
jgi:hypothetical protein